MAKTIAKAYGDDPSRDIHKLGNRSSTGEANTWRTFSKTHINSDGSGHFTLERDGKIIIIRKWGPE